MTVRRVPVLGVVVGVLLACGEGTRPTDCEGPGCEEARTRCETGEAGCGEASGTTDTPSPTPPATPPAPPPATPPVAPPSPPPDPPPDTPECQPRTCEDLGAQCGAVADGCGGTLQCGSCAEGEHCEGEASEAACVPDGTQAEPTEWSTILGGASKQSVLGMGFVAKGDLLVVSVSPPSTSTDGSPQHSRILLQRYGPDGRRLWSRALETPGSNLVFDRNRSAAVTPHGVYLNYAVSCDPDNLQPCMEGDLGEGPFTGAVLVRLTLEGEVAWVRRFGTLPLGLGVGASGDVVVGSADSLWEGERIALFSRSGQKRWEQPHDGALALALDAVGNVHVGGVGFLAMRAPDGRLVRKRELPAVEVLSLDTTSRKAVVAGAILSSGELTWAGRMYFHHSGPGADYLPVVLVADSEGMELWSDSLGPSVGFPRVDVRPSGEVAVAVGGMSSVLRTYSSKGELQLREEVAHKPGGSATSVHATAVALGEEQVAVGGEFDGTADFGLGPFTPEDIDGFVRVFRP